MNSFTYDYPVRNYFDEGAMDQALDAEMVAMGKTVMLAYGGGSVKRTGVYGHVVDKLTSAGKRVVDFGGIMPNPTYEKCQEGAALAREEQVDFILAVGGGSVFDCCKVVSAQAMLDEDIETFEHADGKMPSSFIPMGCIVALSGTGAEQNNGAVITNEETHVKGAFFGALPSWAALDPALTLTVPHAQFMSGAFDTLSHCMESYFGSPRGAMSPMTSTSPSSVTSSATCASSRTTTRTSMPEASSYTTPPWPRTACSRSASQRTSRRT